MQIWPNFRSSFVTVDARKMVLSEWELHPPIAEFLSNTVEIVGKDFQMADEIHPVLLLRLKVSRIWSPYAYQIFLIMGLICACSLTSFSMDVGDSGDRLAQATTMFLTAMAFQFVISSMLPKLDYLTLADKYILTCNIFISAMVFQIGLIGLVQSHFSVEVTTTFDSFLLLGNTTALCLVHVILVYIVRARVMPEEAAKLTTSSEKLAETKLENISVSYKKFHAPSVDDKNGVQLANYLGSDQINGKSITGLFWSDYGHGREYFAVSVCINGKGQEQLLLRKVTGDENVPAGRVSILTVDCIPQEGGAGVGGKIQLRGDITDINAFYFEDVTISIIDHNTIKALWNNFEMIYTRALKDNYDPDAAKRAAWDNEEIGEIRAARAAVAANVYPEADDDEEAE